MRLFVTGATGFVGAHVAQLAAQKGAELRVLARPTSNINHLPRHAEVVVGDLRKPAAFASALQGCDAVSVRIEADDVATEFGQAGRGDGTEKPGAENADRL